MEKILKEQIDSFIFIADKNLQSKIIGFKMILTERYIYDVR